MKRHLAGEEGVGLVSCCASRVTGVFNVKGSMIKSCSTRTPSQINAKDAMSSKAQYTSEDDYRTEPVCDCAMLFEFHLLSTVEQCTLCS